MKKGLTLVETIVATIIASMLLLEIGSAFLMFRQMNNESVADTKADVKILEVEDYITTNVADFIDAKLGKSYFRIDYDDVGSDYSLEYSNGICLLKSGSGINFEIVKKDCLPNHDTIVAFTLPEDYREQPIYLPTSSGNKQVTRLDPGETIYYSGLDDTSLSENLVTYENGTLKFKGETILSDLPYKDVQIKLDLDKPKIKENTSEEKVVDEYTVVKVDDEYELLPFTVEADDPLYGMISIEDVDTVNHTCTLVAHNFIYNDDIVKIDGLIDDEDEEVDEQDDNHDDEHEDEDEFDEDGNKIKEIIEVYTFEGWEGRGEGKNEFTWTIDYKPGEKYVAKFSGEKIRIEILADEDEDDERGWGPRQPGLDDHEDEDTNEESLHYAVDGSLKNTTVTKKVYILECTIEITYKNGSVTELPFVAGLFEKYLPEIYKGGE